MLVFEFCIMPYFSWEIRQLTCVWVLAGRFGLVLWQVAWLLDFGGVSGGLFFRHHRKWPEKKFYTVGALLFRQWLFSVSKRCVEGNLQFQRQLELPSGAWVRSFRQKEANRRERSQNKDRYEMRTPES